MTRRLLPSGRNRGTTSNPVPGQPPQTLRPVRRVCSGILREFSDGLRVPLRDLANLAIVVSDNTASNILMNRVGGDTVNAFMDSLGLAHTRALHTFTGGDRSRLGGWSKAGLREENRKYGVGVSTTRDMVALITLLDRGKRCRQQVGVAEHPPVRCRTRLRPHWPFRHGDLGAGQRGRP
jgi:hypothetical protein